MHALCALCSNFRLRLIVAHIPKFSRPFNKPAFPCPPLVLRHCRIRQLVDLLACHLGGLRRFLRVCKPVRRVAASHDRGASLLIDVNRPAGGSYSALFPLQSHADPSGLVVIHELDTRLLESLLNPEQGRHVTHGDSLSSFDPADGRNRDARYSKGLRTSAPRPATSTIFRVTSVIPCTLAVAASSASVVDNGRLALMRPHSSATT